MACYNCGYEVSVVSRDDIGWLCEWCSDNELRSPVIKRLKKRIEELKNEGINDVEKRPSAYDRCIELQKILEVKK